MQRHPRWTLAATILGSSMAIIDGTVINIALPVLQKSLGADVSQAQWIVDAYLLVLSSLMLARAAQGLGAALLVPGSLAIITATFPPKTRGRAIGTWSAMTSLAIIAG